VYTIDDTTLHNKPLSVVSQSRVFIGGYFKICKW